MDRLRRELELTHFIHPLKNVTAAVQNHDDTLVTTSREQAKELYLQAQNLMGALPEFMRHCMDRMQTETFELQPLSRQSLITLAHRADTTRIKSIYQRVVRAKLSLTYDESEAVEMFHVLSLLNRGGLFENLGEKKIFLELGAGLGSSALTLAAASGAECVAVDGRVSAMDQSEEMRRQFCAERPVDNMKFIWAASGDPRVAGFIRRANCVLLNDRSLDEESLFSYVSELFLHAPREDTVIFCTKPFPVKIPDTFESGTWPVYFMGPDSSPQTGHYVRIGKASCAKFGLSKMWVSHAKRGLEVSAWRHCLVCERRVRNKTLVPVCKNEEAHAVCSMSCSVKLSRCPICSLSGILKSLDEEPEEEKDAAPVPDDDEPVPGPSAPTDDDDEPVPGPSAPTDDDDDDPVPGPSAESSSSEDGRVYPILPDDGGDDDDYGGDRDWVLPDDDSSSSAEESAAKKKRRKKDAEEEETDKKKKRPKRKRKGAECPICEKWLVRGDLLKVHMLIHTQRKRYFCKICKRNFKWESDLAKHVRDSEVHRRKLNNESSYESARVRCKIKGCRKWLSVHSVYDHQEAHNQKMLCPICGAGFTQRASLKKHCRDLHKQGECDFECTRCGAEFSKEAYRDAHERSCKRARRE